MVSKRILVSGKVQGVFYRRWTETTARSLGLTGWVRNLRSGEVEIHVNGASEKVNEMVRRCWEGPAAAQVTGVQVDDMDAETVQGFSARATV